jgi:hypothetical protein
MSANKDCRSQLKKIISLLPVYMGETWFINLTEDHTLILKVFENKVLRKIFGPKREEVTGE